MIKEQIHSSTIVIKNIDQTMSRGKLTNLLKNILGIFRDRKKTRIDASNEDRGNEAKVGNFAIHVPANLNQALYLTYLIEMSDDMMYVFEHQDPECFLQSNVDTDDDIKDKVRMFEKFDKKTKENNKICRFNKMANLKMKTMIKLK